jgi:hypothetical protein
LVCVVERAPVAREGDRESVARMFGLLEGSGLEGLHSDDITRTLPHLAITGQATIPMAARSSACWSRLAPTSAGFAGPHSDLAQRRARAAKLGAKSAGGGLWRGS